MWKRLAGIARGGKGWYVRSVLSSVSAGVEWGSLSCLVFSPSLNPSLSLFACVVRVFSSPAAARPLKVPLSGSKDEACDSEHQQEESGETYLCSAFVLPREKKKKVLWGAYGTFLLLSEHLERFRESWKKSLTLKPHTPRCVKGSLWKPNRSLYLCLSVLHPKTVFFPPRLYF